MERFKEGDWVWFQHYPMLGYILKRYPVAGYLVRLNCYGSLREFKFSHSSLTKAEIPCDSYYEYLTLLVEQ